MSNPKYLIVFMVVAVYIGSTMCDYYTSVSGLDVLLKVEGNLLDSLKDFATKMKDTEDGTIVKSLSYIRDEYAEAKNNPFAYLSNPISAFKLIKRFVVDWTLVEDYIKDTADKGLAINLTKYINGDLELPTEYDLKGAALGLVRLQETYALNVKDLSEGKLLGTKYGSEMSANDCLELGLSLYQAKEYKHSLPWLQETIAKFMKNPFPPKEVMADVLRYLSAAYFYLQNSKMALLLSNEILKIDPGNKDVVENKKIYQADLLDERSSRKLHRQPFKEPKEPSFHELYKMTCRGERHQTPSEQRPLRCTYTTNGIPHRLIGPFKVEQLNLDPPISYYHQVITDSEMNKAIKEAEPIIERSTVGDLSSGFSEVRISKTGWLNYEDHTFLDNIANRLKDLTGLSLTTAESLQIVNYGIGGHYGPHWDFSLEPNEAFGDWRMNRIATALFYINDVELGGGTAFPFLKLTIPPVKGSLVLWFNLHESLEPDFRMKHAGCPVLKGSKWVLNEWFHEVGQEFLRPCSLKQQGSISAPYKHIY